VQGLPPWLPKFMVRFMGTFFVLSCLTAGVVGAGVLALVVCLEGCRRYTWKPLRAARREKLERQERCNHQWGEPVEVGQPHPLFRMRFWIQFCVHGCGKQRHANEDGTPYVPYQWMEEAPREHSDDAEGQG